MSCTAEAFIIVSLNFLSVVGVVALNKAAYRAGFHFATTLMCLHFIGTFLFVSAIHKLGYFQSKKLDRKIYIKLGFLQMGSIVLVNLSLFYNTMGTYQIFKYLNTPLTAVCEYFLLGKTYSAKVYLTLIVLSASVTFATVTSVSFSAAGALCGILAACASSLYQVNNNMVQASEEVNSFQLLQGEQPYTAAFAFTVLFFTDKTDELMELEWLEKRTCLLVLLSCVCAFGSQVTAYTIIGRTSALTFSMVGYMKTLGIFAWGFIALREPFSLNFVGGCSVSFLCMLMYGRLMMQKPPAADSAPPESLEVGDEREEDNGENGEQSKLTNSSSQVQMSPTVLMKSPLLVKSEQDDSVSRSR